MRGGSTEKVFKSIKKVASRWPTAVDLFCGCGGVTEGLKKSRFRVVAAVDNDPVCCRTYKKNHPRVRLYADDINNVDPQVIRDCDLNGEDLDLLVVCAPCQPFSSLNKNRNGDTRAQLILQAIRFASVLSPSIVFFENVPGLAKYEKIITLLKEGLEELGYVVGSPANVDAADYGVPQRRNRCIMLAMKGGEPPDLPPPITPHGARNTVRMAIGDLPPLSSGEKEQSDPLHFARNHSKEALERLAHIPQDGGDRFSLPPVLELKCHKGAKGYPDVYGRMAWDDVAPTLTTGCTDITRGRFAHPRDDRAITLREAALLQTFPERYVFKGNAGQVARQIGNAVPVRLIRELAPTLRQTIRRVRTCP